MFLKKGGGIGIFLFIDVFGKMCSTEEKIGVTLVSTKFAGCSSGGKMFVFHLFFFSLIFLFSRFVVVCCLVSGNPGFMVFTFCSWINFDWHAFPVLMFRPSHFSVCLYISILSQTVFVLFLCLFSIYFPLEVFCCCKLTTVWHCVC